MKCDYQDSRQDQFKMVYDHVDEAYITMQWIIFFKKEDADNNLV